MELADVLSGDAGLAGVRSLLRDPSPRRVLRQELTAMLEGQHSLGPCRLRRAKFKPGRKLTAYFEVDLRYPDGGLLASRPIAVTWSLEERERRRPPASVRAELEAEAGARGLASPFRALEAVEPGSGMHVFVSPLDGWFPHLMRLSDPSFLASIHGAGCRVSVVRYRPGQRHVLRYDLHRRHRSGETVFAKLYQDGRGERTFALATRVAGWLAADGSGAAAVRPLTFLADSRAVLYPGLDGGPISQSLGRRGDHAKLLRQAGALLRALHRAPLALAPQQERHELAAEVRAIARASQHIDALLPEAAPRIAAILDRAQELHERLPHERPVVAHGDFKLDHIWPGDEGLTVIDLDRCCVADPAFDVGKLLADINWWHLMVGRAGPGQAQRDFLNGYAAAAASARVHRARVYEAVLLVKIAARRVALFDRRWPALTEALIARGESTLAALERECGGRRHVHSSLGTIMSS